MYRVAIYSSEWHDEEAVDYLLSLLKLAVKTKDNVAESGSRSVEIANFISLYMSIDPKWERCTKIGVGRVKISCTSHGVGHAYVLIVRDLCPSDGEDSYDGDLTLMAQSVNMGSLKEIAIYSILNKMVNSGVKKFGQAIEELQIPRVLKSELNEVYKLFYM